MKELLKKVYYCDFCKKKGMSKHHMSKHEMSCTMNPNRKCGLCGYNGIKPKEIDDENDCPICHFARLRQTNWTETSYYNLKEAMTKYWCEKNKAEEEADCY